MPIYWKGKGKISKVEYKRLTQEALRRKVRRRRKDVEITKAEVVKVKQEFPKTVEEKIAEKRAKEITTTESAIKQAYKTKTPVYIQETGLLISPTSKTPITWTYQPERTYKQQWAQRYLEDYQPPETKEWTPPKAPVLSAYEPEAFKEVMYPTKEEFEKASYEKYYTETYPYISKVFLPTERFVEKMRIKAGELPYILPYAEAGVGIVYGVTQVGKGLTHTVAHPGTTAKGIYSFGKTFVTKPTETISTIGAKGGMALEEKGLPFAVGTVGGYALGWKGLGYTIKKFPAKVSIRKLELPTKTGKYRWYGVSAEYKYQAQPLIGVSKGIGRIKPTLGTPKVDWSKISLKEGFIGETATATRIIQESIPKTYGKAGTYYMGKEAFTYFLKVKRTTATTRSAFIRRDYLPEVKTLSPKGVKQMIKLGKKYDAVFYGSTAQRGQVPEFLWVKYRGAGYKGLPADIDKYFKYSEAETIFITKEALSRLKLVGEKVRISKVSPTLIEAKVAGKWKHAVDIHSMEPTMDVLSPAYAKQQIWGMPLSQRPIIISGTKYMPLAEQTLRKGGSIFTLRPKGFAPEPHRIKDIGDYLMGEEALLLSKKWVSPTTIKYYTKLRSMYPAEVLKEAPTTTMFPIYAPSKPIYSTYVPVVSPPMTVTPKFESKMQVYPSVKSYAKVLPSLVPSLPPSPVSISPYKVSPSVSPKPSPRPSPSISPSLKPSRSIYPSMPPSPSISPSPPSPSPSISPYISPTPSPSPSISPSVYYPKPYKTPPPPFKTSEMDRLPSKGLPAYKVFIKRFGEFKPLKGVYTKREALLKGAWRTHRTLAATFKVEPAKGMAVKKGIPEFPFFKKQFRPFKVKKGKKIKLGKTFIERRKFRLSAPTEVKEIQWFKKSKRFF